MYPYHEFCSILPFPFSPFLFFFSMAGEILQHHAFAKNIQFLNRQASALSSQSQISQNCNDFLPRICSPSAVWCPVCCPVSIWQWNYPILKTCQPSLLRFCGFYWISYDWTEPLCCETPDEVIMSLKFSYQYFILREHVGWMNEWSHPFGNTKALIW